MLDKNEHILESEHWSPKRKITLDLLGILMVKHPRKVKALLSKYGKAVHPRFTVKETVHAVVDLLKQDIQAFNYDLAELLVNVISEIDDKGSPNGYANFEGESAVNIGLDPVSAVAGAVGSIAKLLGQSKQKKLLQQQAKALTLSKIIAYKTKQNELKAKQRRQFAQQLNRMNFMKIAGLLALFGMLLWWLFKKWSHAFLT